MDVASIKTSSWIVSCALSLGLGYTVWDYLERDGSRRITNSDGGESLVVVDPDYVRAVIESDVRLEVDVKEGLAYKGELQRTFLLMNWTGYEAPPEVQPIDQGPVDTGPRYKPLDQVLRVLMLAVDDLDPGSSWAAVALLPDGEQLKLRVGQTLPKPNDFAVVYAIREEGVDFSFTQEGRPNETIVKSRVDDGSLIKMLADGDLHQSSKNPIPSVKRDGSKRLDQTTEIANNIFELGAQDVDYFGKNYAAILTDEVRTSTYYDEDGNRAGVEILSVKSGSIASRHGVQTGDVLISINGKPMSSEHEAINFVKNNQGQYSAWEVVVQRLGRRETIVYTDPGN